MIKYAELVYHYCLLELQWKTYLSILRKELHFKRTPSVTNHVYFSLVDILISIYFNCFLNIESKKFEFKGNTTFFYDLYTKFRP